MAVEISRLEGGQRREFACMYQVFVKGPMQGRPVQLPMGWGVGEEVTH